MPPRETLLIGLIALTLLAVLAWFSRGEDAALIEGGAYAVEFGGEAIMEAEYLDWRATREARP